MSTITLWDNGNYEIELVEDPGTEGIRLTIVGHVLDKPDTAEGADEILAFLDEQSRSISEIRRVVQSAKAKLQAAQNAGGPR